MTELYQALLVASGVTYVGLLMALWWGLGRIRPGASDARPSVAVVIAARDEAANIDACLSHLADQDYPPDLLQVAVVDDGSSDDTRNRAEHWQDRMPGLRVLAAGTPPYRCRKKSAVDAGIRATRGDLILTTDADCRPPPGWVTSLVRGFAPDVGVVAGHAPLSGTGGLGKALLTFQAVVVAGLSAGSAGLGFPLTCTGRNLAYRRDAFHQVGGFDAIGHIVGGDDVLLMRRISRLTDYTVRYLADPSSHVPSNVHDTGLFRRQIRYQSKTVHAGAGVLILAICVYIFHLALAVGPVLSWSSPALWQPLGLLFALRVAADGAFLWRSLGLLGSRGRLAWLPVIELISVPYVILFFALGAAGAPRWK